MSYNKVVDLIKKWEEYESLFPNHDLASFGKWLSLQDEKQQNSDIVQRKQDKYLKKWDSYEEGLKHHHDMKSNDVQIGILLGRLNRYARMYAKKKLHHLNLNLDEFTFLAAIFHLKNPKKSDVINLNLFEPTSGTEILRRLIKINYIKEKTNNEDKRSKLLRITALGEKTILKAFEEMAKVGTLTSANLNDKQKIELIKTLDYLNDFHVHLYLNHKDASVDEMLEKYLGKKETAK